MAFVTNKSNQNNKVNTTTKVVQMYNPNGDDAGTLTLGYWNNYATMKINPALEPAKRTQGKVYNYDVNASVILNAEVITTLYRGVLTMESRVKAKQEGVPSVAVRAGQYIIKVGLSSDYEGMIGDYYLAFFELDNAGHPTGSIFYPFAAQDSDDDFLLFGWDEQTGSASTTIPVNSQWQMFKNFLKQASEELVSGGAHGALSQTNIWITRLTNSLDVIKSLIEMLTVSGSKSVGEQRNPNGFAGGSSFGGRTRNMGSASTVGGGRRTSINNRVAPTQTVAPEEVVNTAPKEEVIDSILDIENELNAELEVDIDDL